MSIDFGGVEGVSAWAVGHEFIFIDQSVPDFEQLIAGIKPGATVVLLDPARDALQQIAEAVSGLADVSAIHIVSHGQDGTIQFSSGGIDGGNIAEHQQALAEIGASLTANADILLYGCDIAASPEGQTLIDAIALATGADVAASTDTTGSAGDWALEYSTGAIEAGAPVSDEAQAGYADDLALVTENFEAGVGPFSTSMFRFTTIVPPSTNHVLLSNGGSDMIETIKLASNAKFQVQDFQLFRPNQSGGTDAVLVLGKNASGDVIFTQQYATPKGATVTITVNTVVTTLELVPVTVTGSGQQFVGTGSLLLELDNLRYDLDVPANSPPQVTGLIGSSIRAFQENGAVYPFSDPAVGINAIIQDADGDQVTVTVRADEGRARGLLVSAVDANGKFMATLPDGTMTFTGTPAEASYLVQQLNFILTNVDDKVDTGQVYRTTFTITVNDGVNSTVVNTQAQVDITGVNEAPSIVTTAASATALAALQHQKIYDRDFISPFTTIVIDDPDNKPVTVGDVPPDALTVRVSFLDANGALVGPGWTKEGVVAGVATWKFTGNYLQATTAIQTVQFDPTDRFTPGLVVNTSFTITVTDAGGLSAPPFNVVISVDAKTNTSPVLTGPSDNTHSDIIENANGPVITVSSLLSGTGHTMTDVDTGQRQGIAITTVTGNWQYSTDGGTTWTNVGAVSATSALVLAATAQLRMLGSDINGDVSFDYKAWDRSSWLTNVGGTASTTGTRVLVDASGFSTPPQNVSPFSLAKVTDHQHVIAVNDAPVVSGVAVLAAVNEDSSPAGATVSSLFASHFSDAADNQTAFGGSAANLFAGVAVVGNAETAAQGKWQYFAAGTWHDIGAPTTGNALVLAAGTLVRFAPAPNFFGAPGGLTVVVIDNSSGAVGTGAIVDLSGPGATGGETQYSTGTVNLSTTVNSVNDAPVGANATLTINEDTAHSFSAAEFGFTDPQDAAGPGGANALQAVVIVDLPLAGTLTYNGLAVVPGQSIPAGSLANLVYTPAPDANGDNHASFTFKVVDNGSLANGGVNTAEETATITFNVTPVDDAPTLSATAVNPTFTENGAGVDLFGAVAVSTIEPGQSISGMTLTITNVTDGSAEILAVGGVDVALTHGNSVPTVSGVTVTVSLSGTTATLVFSGPGLSTGEAQSLIDTLTYRNLSENPTDANRVVTITELVDSGSNAVPNVNTASLGVSSIVNVDGVNDAPGVVAPAGLVGPPNVAFAITGVTFSDIDGNGGDETATFTTGAGSVLTAIDGGGVTVTGSGTNNLTLTGTTAELTAFIAGNGLSFTGSVNDTVHVVIDDNGNSPAPAQTSATSDIVITLNQPPVANTPPPAGAAEDPASRIQIDLSGSDADAGDGIDSFTITGLAANGQLFAAATGGVALTAGAAIAAVGNGASVYFQPGADWNGVTTFTYTAFDGDSASAPATATITVTPVADIADDAATVGEDSGTTQLNLLGNDSFENGDRAITSVGPAAHGTVAIDTLGNADPADDTVTYTPDADYNGSDTFTYTVTSGGVTETATVNVTVTAVADAVTDALTVTEDGSVTANVLTGTNGASADSFAPGRSVISVTQGANGSVVFAADGTVTYTPNADFNGPDSFTYTVTSGGVTETGTVNVTVNAVNDAPVLTLNPALPLLVNENVQVPLVTNGGTVADVEGIGAGGSLTVAGLLPEDRISVADQGSGAGQIGYDSGAMTVSFGGTVFANVTLQTSGPNVTGVVYTFNGNVSDAAINALVGALLYTDASDTPTFNRLLTLTLNDGTDDGVPAVVPVMVNPVNDAPVNGLPAVLPQLTNEDTALVFSALNGNAITVSDPDVPAGQPVVVVLTATNGTMTLSGTAGLGFGGGDGTDDASMTFSGTIADINAALEGMTFSPTAGYTGAASIQIVTNDQGASGIGSVGVDDDTIAITVGAINDGPTVTLPAGPYATFEQTNLPLKNSGITIADPDSAGADVTVTLTVAEGRLTIDAGSSGAVVTNNASASVTLTGTIAEINDLLNTNATSSVTYRSLTDTPAATVELTVTVDDLGNTGTGGPITDSGKVNINITAINDSPENLSGGPLDLTDVNEFATNGTVLGTVVVTDPENDPLTYSLTDNAGGRFAINATTGQVTVRDGILLDFEQQTSHSITVSVTDGSSPAFVQTIVIGVKDVNPEVVYANNLANTLVGGALDDFFRGFGGVDVLRGAAGNDMLEGGAGADQLIGGTGLDLASYKSSAAGVHASLQAPGSNTGDAAGDTYSGIENLRGSEFNDVLTGNSAANVLAGGSGADTMIGLKGNDVFYVDNLGDKAIETTTGGTDRVISSKNWTLGANLEYLTLTGTAANGTGNALNNYIDGNSGANLLKGLGGHDVLWGSLGKDTLTGGSGHDRFDFRVVSDSAPGANRDVITDFTQGQDRINLDPIDARTNVGGNQDFSFIGAAAFTGVSGQLRSVQTGSGATAKTMITGDVNGDKVADIQIELTGHRVMHAVDFYL